MKALVVLLKNKVVRNLIIDIAVGIIIGVIAKINKEVKNEERKRLLLHMQEWSPNSWKLKEEGKVRPESKRMQACEEGTGICRKRSYKRDYL